MPDLSRAHELAFHHSHLIAYRECGRARQRNGAKGAVVHAHRRSICIALLRVLFDLAAGDRASGPKERDRSATSPDRLLAGARPACRRSGAARFIAHLDDPDGLDRTAQSAAIRRDGLASGVCGPRVALLRWEL